MHITNKKKILGALAVAGVVAASGSAFTGGGLGTAPTAGFVGGSVSHSVIGSTVTGVAYDTDEAANLINSVTLTFGDTNVAGKTPTIAFTGGNSAVYNCAPVAASGTTSLCSPAVTDTKQPNSVTGTTVTVV